MNPKFKEQINTNEKLQTIEDILLEEVPSENPEAIEIYANIDDSSEFVTKEVKDILGKKYWWLRDGFSNEGSPNEQLEIIARNNKYLIYNFNNKLSDQEKDSILKAISFIDNTVNNVSSKEITFIIRKTQKINPDSAQPYYGSCSTISNFIDIYPRALSDQEYREIPEVNGICATTIHELAHIVYNDMGQDKINEWFRFGWEKCKESEITSEPSFGIKPVDSNVCITKYAKFAPDEDFCESMVGYYANSQKLSIDKRNFITKYIFNHNSDDSQPTCSIKSINKIELPEIPKLVKFSRKKKDVSFTIVK